jgi:hypothetical protein
MAHPIAFSEDSPIFDKNDNQSELLKSRQHHWYHGHNEASKEVSQVDHLLAVSDNSTFLGRRLLRIPTRARKIQAQRVGGTGCRTGDGSMPELAPPHPR